MCFTRGGDVVGMFFESNVTPKLKSFWSKARELGNVGIWENYADSASRLRAEALEEQLQYERESFEYKSQKILTILQQKDDQISHLTASVRWTWTYAFLSCQSYEYYCDS